MRPPRPPLIAGNWKMHGLKASVAELERIVRDSAELRQRLDLMVCPPATLIEAFAAIADGIAIGGQDCHPEPNGAFTGDISAEMLADLGARAVIVGHSERRSYHGETDDEVRRKVTAAWRAGLTAVLCIGESREDRVAGRTLKTVGAQLQGSLPDRAQPERLVIAYEPVWAPASRRRRRMSPRCTALSAPRRRRGSARRGRGCAFSMAGRSSPPMPPS
jgi:triosephosphate isomerase